MNKARGEFVFSQLFSPLPLLFSPITPPFLSVPLLSPSPWASLHSIPLLQGYKKKHRWSLLTCYSSLCQKLCQNNAPQQQAEGFYLFLLMSPVNFTDVSLGLNHQLISFVPIKRLILNMNRAGNVCLSEPKPDNVAPTMELLEHEAGR